VNAKRFSPRLVNGELLTHPGLSFTRRSDNQVKTKTHLCEEGLAGVGEFVVHENDLNTLKAAVLERVFYVEKDGAFVPPPKPKKGAMQKELRPSLELLFEHTHEVTPWTHAQFVESYRDRRKVRYQQACDSLAINPVCKADSVVKGFVKREKIAITKEKPNPVPRIIQPRDPRYNVEVGVFIRPMEQMIYEAINGLFGYEVVAKGKNAEQTAQMFVSAWGRYEKPVGIGYDAKRYDQSISVDALRVEHSVYLHCAPRERRRHLGRLLSWQLATVGRGYTLDGVIRWKVKGQRKSGDMNTSVGNVLLMCIKLHAFLLQNDLLEHVTVINNGDDFVLVCDVTTVRRLDGMVAWFLRLGFRLAKENPETTMERVEFCQGRPIFDGHVWTMVRDVRRTLDKDAICLAPVSTRRELAGWCTAVGECGLALTGGMPILDQYYTRLVNSERARHHITLQTAGLAMLASGMTRVSAAPTDDCRLSFYKAFDITPDEQILAETAIASTPLCLDIYEDDRDEPVEPGILQRLL